MEKKYNCTCYIKNARDKISALNGEVYVASNGFLRIDYPNKNGFFVSDFSLSINDIYECKNEDNNTLEIVCFTDTYSLSHVAAEYKELDNYLYKFTIYIKEVKALYKDICDAKKKNLERNKKSLESLINQKTKKLITSSENYIKIKSSYGRMIPKKIFYTGFAYESFNGKCLTIQFDNESEKKYLGQQIGNNLENTRVDIKYEDIIDYYIQSKKLYIKVYDNRKYDFFTKQLLYFGKVKEEDIYEIILEGEELSNLKKLLSKRVILENIEEIIEEKNQEKIRRIEETEKKYKSKSSTGLGIFIIFYILFYPIFWLISLPFMIISNFTGSSEKYSPNKTWNDWWNTKS